MMRRQRQRGATLIEIMISMAIVLVGMLAMFSVLTSAINGSSTASRMSQAQMRATTILESIRQSPSTALVCLASANNATTWSNCETPCKNALTVASQDACLYSMTAYNTIKQPDTATAGQTTGQSSDRNGQVYLIDPNSRVALAGVNSAVYDVRVIIGWNDDNSSTTTQQAGYHTMQLRTGVFPVQ